MKRCLSRTSVFRGPGMPPSRQRDGSSHRKSPSRCDHEKRTWVGRDRRVWAGGICARDDSFHSGVHLLRSATPNVREDSNLPAHFPPFFSLSPQARGTPDGRGHLGRLAGGLSYLHSLCRRQPEEPSIALSVPQQPPQETRSAWL